MAVALKLYRNWQPLQTEDARTALVFGFLRHAPPQHALTPWLTETLDRPATASGLEPENFWPSYRSHVDGATRTEPDLVFEADDGRPLHVIVEAKFGFNMHLEDQLVREVIDCAREASAERVALIAVGADLGAPVRLPGWRKAIDDALAVHGLRDVAVSVHYSSWAQLGRWIERCAERVPALGTYAADTLAQLRFHELLGYEGAPVFEDLEGLTVTNAFAVFNRSIAAARQFFLTLHDQDAFRAASLEPAVGGGHRMFRNGTSVSLKEDVEWFQVDTFIALYRRQSWDEGLGAYVAFYFPEEDEPGLHAGALHTTDWTYVRAEYAWTDDVDEVKHPKLKALDAAQLPSLAAGSATEFVFDDRPWTPGSADDDIAWALSKIQAAARGLDSS